MAAARGIRIWKFFAAAAAGFLVCLVVATGLFVYQFGRSSRESLGRCSFVEGKVQAINALPGPRIVFIGGSNVHWGINAESAGQALGRAGGNFGTFASLGPELILWEARKTLRPGDVAVLAFEYELYHRGAWTSQALDFMLACGRPYFDQLDLLDKARAVLSAPLNRVLKLSRRRHAGPSLPPTVSPNGDPYLRASTFHPVSRAEQGRLALYRPAPIPVNPSSMDVRAIKDFADWGRAHGVAVVATWPNTIYFPSYEANPAFAKIRKLYAEMGVPVVGTPTGSMMGLKEFYDTQYHLRAPGIEARTAGLVQAIERSPGVLAPPLSP